jgi:hypothetical protein
MAYTRVELQAQIDALLMEDVGTQCTRSLLNGLLSNILSSVTMQDESANTIEVAGINLTDPVIGLSVSGDKVVGARMTGITSVNESTGTLADVRVICNMLIQVLHTHGLIGDPA